MPMGAGLYDDLCTYVRKKAKAASVVVLVIGGERGSGMSVQTHSTAGTPEQDALHRALPELLRNVANQIEESLAPKGNARKV